MGDKELIERLQAERNSRVASTDLGRLSERLEEDNSATDASLVRKAMHRLEDLEQLVPLAAELAEIHIQDGDELGVLANRILKITGRPRAG